MAFWIYKYSRYPPKEPSGKVGAWSAWIGNEHLAELVRTHGSPTHHKVKFLEFGGRKLAYAESFEADSRELIAAWGLSSFVFEHRDGTRVGGLCFDGPAYTICLSVGAVRHGDAVRLVRPDESFVCESPWTWDLLEEKGINPLSVSTVVHAHLRFGWVRLLVPILEEGANAAVEDVRKKVLEEASHLIEELATRFVNYIEHNREVFGRCIAKHDLRSVRVVPVFELPWRPAVILSEQPDGLVTEKRFLEDCTVVLTYEFAEVFQIPMELILNVGLWGDWLWSWDFLKEWQSFFM